MADTGAPTVLARRVKFYRPRIFDASALVSLFDGYPS